MSGFEPGEGWRRLAKGERDQDEMIVYYGDEGSVSWVREAPVPPLPTEPYTVIRVTWARGARKGVSDVLVKLLGGWCDTESTIYLDGTLQASITGFEVLSEPRAVTAKAVLARALHLFDTGSYIEEAIHQVRGEFGVDQ